MDLGREFKKFATKEKGVSSTYYNDIISSMFPSALTPNIIEERQMNIAIFDVFSRLMMDRIIFLGTAINDQDANIIVGQAVNEAMEGEIQVTVIATGFETNQPLIQQRLKWFLLA